MCSHNSICSFFSFLIETIINSGQFYILNTDDIHLLLFISTSTFSENLSLFITLNISIWLLSTAFHRDLAKVSIEISAANPMEYFCLYLAWPLSRIQNCSWFCHSRNTLFPCFSWKLSSRILAILFQFSFWIFHLNWTIKIGVSQLSISTSHYMSLFMLWLQPLPYTTPLS